MKKLFKMSFLILGVSFFLGCGADKPEEEVVNSNKETVEVSTPAKKNTMDSLLKAPGNYIRNTVGNIDKAKKASAVYENSALDHMDVSESTGE